MKNLWEINAERHKTKHPTEKPETLLQRIILLGSNEGQTVLDPFMGSGTTGAVAQKLRRNFIGIEISKEYFDIASKRISIELPQELQFNGNGHYNGNGTQQTMTMESEVEYQSTKKTKTKTDKPTHKKTHS